MYTILFAGGAAAAVCLYVFRFWNKNVGNVNKPSLQEKVFLVTGANSGLGKETVRELASRSATVIMACRNLQSAEDTVNDIRRTVASGKLIPMQLDLASFKSIHSFADQVVTKFNQVHVLVNNAGVSFPANVHLKTEDGIELQFGVNYVGHFLLTNLLLEKLKSSAPSRIVNVSSLLHKSGVIDFEDLDGDIKKHTSKGHMHPGYSNSKLANIYHTIELAKRLKGTGVDAFVLSPGFCFTGLTRHVPWPQYGLILPLLFFFTRSALSGAQGIVYCATQDGLTSGGFYRDCKPYVSPMKFDLETSSRLWEVTEALTTMKT